MESSGECQVCNNKIKEAKRKYHCDLIEENKKNPKFWEAIKSVFPSKSKSSIISMQKSKTRDMVNTFSKYFATVVSELKLRLGLSFSSYIWKPHYTQPRKTNKSFTFSYISKVFVEKQLSSMKRKKATGTDELPAGMIKDCAKAISKPLSYIVNLSLQTGVFPTVWKNAKITPVYKSGDTGKPENFRPISVLPIFSKILEKAVHGQLSSFLEENKLLTEFQFGYRQNRSTSSHRLYFSMIFAVVSTRGSLLALSISISPKRSTRLGTEFSYPNSDGTGLMELNMTG